MKPNVRKLVPREAVEPVARVDAFIRLARLELDSLIRSEDWELPSWQVGQSFRTKGQNRETRYFHFYRVGSIVNRGGAVDGPVLDPHFIDFAKAYCRYTHATSPSAYENEFKRLKALQCVEEAFRMLGYVPHISDCNVSVLNRAVALASEGVGDARHNQIAMTVQQIHRFCTEHLFYHAPFQWRHGVKKPTDRTLQLGEVANKMARRAPSKSRGLLCARPHLSQRRYVYRQLDVGR